MVQPLRKPRFDEFGLLINPDAWTPDLARRLARQEGIETLEGRHWRYINALRDYYQRFRVPPPPARICRDLTLSHGCGHELFHTCLAAWRIAGLPDPGEEAKAYLSAS